MEWDRNEKGRETSNRIRNCKLESGAWLPLPEIVKCGVQHPFTHHEKISHLPRLQLSVFLFTLSALSFCQPVIIPDKSKGEINRFIAPLKPRLKLLLGGERKLCR